MNIPLSPYAPENLVLRDGFSRPVPPQPAHSPYSGLISCLLTGFLQISVRRPFIYLNNHTPSGLYRFNRVTHFCVPMAFTAESPPAQKICGPHINMLHIELSTINRLIARLAPAKKFLILVGDGTFAQDRSLSAFNMLDIMVVAAGAGEGPTNYDLRSRLSPLGRSVPIRSSCLQGFNRNTFNEVVYNRSIQSAGTFSMPPSYH